MEAGNCACGNRAVYVLSVNTFHDLADLLQVTKVAPLGNRESAQLLADLMPRKLGYTELEIQSGSPHTAIMSALGHHPGIKKVEEHPGTLVIALL